MLCHFLKTFIFSSFYLVDIRLNILPPFYYRKYDLFLVGVVKVYPLHFVSVCKDNEKCEIKKRGF